MRTITVNTIRPYNVYIQKGILNFTGNCIKQTGKVKNVLIVSDTKVSKLYLKDVLLSLSDYNVYTYTFRHGEKSKNIATVLNIINVLSKNYFTRDDIIISLGGGVCSDITGFAASIYKRGIPYINIPTSLMAMVDCSIGGKTAVNTVHGKNLLGSFYQPRMVLIDPSVLSTLPDDYYSEGMAEVIKTFLIRDSEMFYKLYNEEEIDIEDIIYRSLEIKAEIVSKDEFDKGERMLLNFGHTFGHAIEKLSNYKIRHGKAIAVGMLKIIRFSEKEDFIDTYIYDKVEKLLKRYNLPVKVKYTDKELLAAILHDKKISGGEIKLAVISDIGVSQVKTFDLKDVIRIYCYE